jgi:NRPS condensation-like uncharacterized protein
MKTKKLDIKNLEKKFQELLANETPESLTEWIEKHRRKHKYSNMKDKLIQIEEDQLEKLKQKAKENDRSVNAEIRQAIKKHLKQ